MASLTVLTTPAADGDRYRLVVPAGWHQGRGVFGGFSIAALVRAIEHRVGDPTRAVRTVTAELPAPVEVGDATIAVEVLRTGKHVTAARATLTQGDGTEVRAHVVAVLASPRPAGRAIKWRDLEPPSAPSWRALDYLPMRRDDPTFTRPEFAQHFEYRSVEGFMLEGAEDARAVGWIRPRVPCAVRDAGYVASLTDAWWPAAIVRFPSARALATIAYKLDIVGDLDGLDPEAPLLYRGTVPVCSDGYFVEQRELWGADGRLIALNHQTFAIMT